ncbi:MAG: hypothetical protein R3247_02005 [Rhodothermales bacterium]|nr:hypothetical protein [Rhodothermales bacterium]
MTAVINPPKIDREKLCREAQRRRAALALARRMLSLLGPGETLGTPVREGDRLVVPIGSAEASPEEDAPALRALTAAWAGAPAL